MHFVALLTLGVGFQQHSQTILIHIHLIELIHINFWDKTPRQSNNIESLRCSLQHFVWPHASQGVQQGATGPLVFCRTCSASCIAQLHQRYGSSIPLHPHWLWLQLCCGATSITWMEQKYCLASSRSFLVLVWVRIQQNFPRIVWFKSSQAS